MERVSTTVSYRYRHMNGITINSVLRRLNNIHIVIRVLSCEIALSNRPTYRNGLSKTVKCYLKCLDDSGDYEEKYKILWTFCMSGFIMLHCIIQILHDRETYFWNSPRNIWVWNLTHLEINMRGGRRKIWKKNKIYLKGSWSNSGKFEENLLGIS